MREKYWHVAAADKRGAQWGFLVRGKRPPTVFSVAKLMKTHGRVVELSGQMVEAATIDAGTLQIVGDGAAIRRIKNGAPRFSIEGDPID